MTALLSWTAAPLLGAVRSALQAKAAVSCCAVRRFATHMHVPDQVLDVSDEESANEAPDGGGVDIKYRSATETVWPASRHQEKFAARLHEALSNVLMGEDLFRDGLVRRLGFSIKEIRMSPDNLKAFVLWDSVLGKTDAVEHELSKRMPRLRSAAARMLGARNMPRLEFRHDRLSGRQQAIEDIFRQLEEERAVEQEVTQHAQHGGAEAQEGERYRREQAQEEAQGQQRGPAGGD